MPEHLDDLTSALLVPFDVDCGEVVPGRHLWLRGLVDDGTWPDALGNRLPDEAGESTRMVSLAWEVVPPVGPDDPDAAAWFQSDLARVRYEVEPALSWDIDTASGVGGGSLDTPPGRPAAHGTDGPYPLSPDAHRVTFTLTPYVDAHHEPGGPGGVHRVVHSAQDPIGRVVVDLAARAAEWFPLSSGDDEPLGTQR